MYDPEKFFDKVYACWMGKNIGGTLGGPLEGRMERLNITGYTQDFVEPVENDDLDLQIVNLYCLEQYGGQVNTALLSREWLEHVHFPFDEYGHALTNLRRGLGTPLSGCYNNFFTDCMGSPIRSEIWAVICAGLPDLAAYYAYQDASVDHAGGEGMYGEIFFAVLESLAFEEKDPFRLIDAALSYLPQSSVVYQSVSLLLRCFHKGMSWMDARQCILDQFAGDNFTYAPVNIAFTLIGWLYEEGFTRQILTTLNCGYDTDCTAATLGSLLGILYGTQYLDPYWVKPLGDKIVTSRPITGFSAPKTITELTERSLKARKMVLALYEQRESPSDYRIPYQSGVEVYALPMGSFKKHDLVLTIKRCPALAPGEKKPAVLQVYNGQNIAQTLQLIPRVDGFQCSSAKFTLKPGETRDVILTLTAPREKSPLFRGWLEVRRFFGKTHWNSEWVSFNCLPSMDWRYDANGTSGILHLTENRIGREQIPQMGSTLALETVLSFEEDGPAVLKIACANPLKVWLDGIPLIDCPERTIVIPAYHRADARKCADLPDRAGKHLLRIEIADAHHFEELYFMAVSPEFYWSYRIDSMYSVF